MAIIREVENMEFKDKESGKKYEISYSQKMQKKGIIQKWIIIGILIVIMVLFGLVAWTGVLSQLGRMMFCGA